ncbi:MAG: hypothetical protein Ct9H300mP8_09000 [Gammaproteobacteria bacterium]|nr:MAG: hypothetical protein Ct9H300mP8_09000 [Gammaproteobacteria bacterium]
MGWRGFVFGFDNSVRCSNLFHDHADHGVVFVHRAWQATMTSFSFWIVSSWKVNLVSRSSIRFAISCSVMVPLVRRSPGEGKNRTL